MIGRVDEILRSFQGGRRVLTLSEIARSAGIPKQTVSRISAELVERRILERSGNDYRLGIRLFELGEHASRPSDLRKLAFAHMADLRGATRQTVHLAVLEGTDVVYIEILPSRSTPPLPSRVGGRLPAYATGVGKALLSHLTDAQLDAILPDPLPLVGPRTLTDGDALRKDLHRIREEGVAYEREESAPRLGCAAAAILGADAIPIAAISVSVHLDTVDLSALGPAVATAANALSREAKRLQILR